MNVTDWVFLRQGGGIGQYRVKVVNNASGLPIYYGFAPRGTATQEQKWMVSKITYDGSGNFLEELTSPVNSVWDDYLTLDYQ